MISCAVEQAPLGGAPDTEAPVPDSLNSTPNKQLFFEKQTIELVFNEWVQLKNPAQIVVSPPLEYGLKSKLKKKSLLIEFDEEEELLPNTTYTINLGQAIVDYTVGNPMENYTYVFSTGAYLDSLSIFGTIRDDKSGEPVEDALVSLYANLQDTAFFTTRPLYFARTNEAGQYRIDNVRSDSFRIYALDDKNLNYFKDQETEAMGFLKGFIVLDSVYKGPTNLGFFLPEQSLRITSKTQEYGNLQVSLNKIVDSLNYRFDPILTDYNSIFTGDSLFVWYNNDLPRSIIFDISEEKKDTIELFLLSDSLKYSTAMNLKGMNTSAKKRLSPLDTLELNFNSYVTDFDSDKFILQDTAGKTVDIVLLQDSKDGRKLKLKTRWLENVKYDLMILPGAVTNNYETVNDTIKNLLFTNTLEKLGEINFVLDSLNEEYHYIVELKNGNETLTREIRQKKSAIFSIKSLSKGNYEVKVIEDKNRNGRWDSGDFATNKYSEKWISKKLDELKVGWTLEATINGNEFK